MFLVVSDCADRAAPLLLSPLVPYRLRAHHEIEMAGRRCQQPSLLIRKCWIRTNEVTREANIERDGRLEELDLFLRQASRQRLDIILQMLDLTTAHDGEHVRRFAQDIRQCNSRDRLDTVLHRDRSQRLGYRTFVVGLLRAKYTAQSLALFLAFLDLLRGLEVSAAQGVPQGRGPFRNGAPWGRYPARNRGASRSSVPGRWRTGFCRARGHRYWLLRQFTRECQRYPGT